MFEDEKNNKIYNLIITNGIDSKKEYAQFTEKLFSKVDFLWKESISPEYTTAGDTFFQKVDRIILLSGIYKENKKTFHDLIDAGKKYKIPIILVRPYGLEEIPETLEKNATAIVGWNANCIVDTIKNSEEIME